MEEDEGYWRTGELLDGVEHCPECGHASAHDEPAHFADCRYFVLPDEEEEEPLLSDIRHSPPLAA